MQGEQLHGYTQERKGPPWHVCTTPGCRLPPQPGRPHCAGCINAAMPPADPERWRGHQWRKAGLHDSGVRRNGADRTDHEFLAAQLGELCEAGRIGRARDARSLLRAWSDRGWTPRQTRFAAYLIRAVDPIPGERREIAPATCTADPRPDLDHRPDTQADRAIKRARLVRWRNRHRKAEVAKLKAGGFTYRAIEAAIGVAKSTAQRWLTEPPLPPPAWRNRKPVPAKPILSRLPNGTCQPALLKRVPGRVPTLFRSLIAWLGLKVNANVTRTRIIEEGRRLNAMLDLPLSEAAVGKVCLAADKHSRKWRK